MLDNDYIYTPASTDITLRWKKIYGYVPASEQEYYKTKWSNFKEKFNKTLDDSDAIFIDPKVQQIWRKHKV